MLKNTGGRDAASGLETETVRLRAWADEALNEAEAYLGQGRQDKASRAFQICSMLLDEVSIVKMETPHVVSMG